MKKEKKGKEKLELYPTMLFLFFFFPHNICCIHRFSFGVFSTCICHRDDFEFYDVTVKICIEKLFNVRSRIQQNPFIHITYTEKCVYRNFPFSLTVIS